MNVSVWFWRMSSAAATAWPNAGLSSGMRIQPSTGSVGVAVLMSSTWATGKAELLSSVPMTSLPTQDGSWPFRPMP